MISEMALWPYNETMAENRGTNGGDLVWNAIKIGAFIFVGILVLIVIAEAIFLIRLFIACGSGTCL